MTEIFSAAASLDVLTAQIKLKLVENYVITNAFNRNINQNSVAIGQWLTQAKKLVPYKQWQIWLNENFKMTKQAADNYIRVAEFNFAALIELAKIDAANVEKFLAENPNAENLSVRTLREQIKKWKKPAPPVIVTAPADASPLKLPPPMKRAIINTNKKPV